MSIIIKYGLYLAFTILMASGQLFIKKAAVSTDRITSVEGLFKTIFSTWMMAACVVYFVALAIYLVILQQLELNQAYLFLLFSTILVPLGAWYFFDEILTWGYTLGFILIVGGMVLAQQ